jgi:hypothetical protein
MDQETKQILAKCSISTRVAAKTFFPERFHLPFAEEVHGEIFKLIDGPENKVAIAAPRGWGKTSVVALALMARWILFRHTGFICYINKSHDAASLQTENLRRELVSNRMIRHFFGDVRQRDVKTSEFEEVFSKKSWVAYDTLVWPRGAGQQVRGVLFKNDRPGLIIIDDLEDPEKIENEEIRKGWYQWLYADVIKAVPRIGKQATTYKIVYIDTLKHEDSVLQKLLDSPEWASVRLEACDDDFNPTAPQFMSKEDIDKEWQAHMDAGQTDVFFRELRNLPISTKDSAFQKQYFHYYNITEQDGYQEGDLKLFDVDVQNDKNVENIVIVDPAKTVKLHSAESSIVNLGLDMKNARILVRDIISEKFYPDELYDAMFDLAIRSGAKAIGIEETGLAEFIKQPIKNEMFKRSCDKGGAFFELIWLKARGGQKGEKGKVLRIKELIPYYRQGYIYHNKRCANTKKLESQLLMFPRSKLWDIMDCVAYVIEMLELGERYFTPQQNLQDVEAEYDQLEYDEALTEWEII